LVRPTEEDLGGQVPARLAAQAALNGDGLEREFPDARLFILFAPFRLLPYTWRTVDFARMKKESQPKTVECPICHREVGLRNVRDREGHRVMAWHFLPNLTVECHGSGRSPEAAKTHAAGQASTEP
jgi:hypothetical protein